MAEQIKTNPLPKTDSSKNLRSYPSITSRKTLEGKPLFVEKEWMRCIGNKKHLKYNHIPGNLKKAITSTKIVKYKNELRQLIHLNNLFTGDSKAPQFQWFYIRLETPDFLKFDELWERREQWVEYDKNETWDSGVDTYYLGI